MTNSLQQTTPFSISMFTKETQLFGLKPWEPKAISCLNDQWVALSWVHIHTQIHSTPVQEAILQCPVPLKICLPSVPALDLPLSKLKGAAPKSIKTLLRALLYTMRCEKSENKGYTSSGPTKNGACWQQAVSDWLRINMEMEV